MYLKIKSWPKAGQGTRVLRILFCLYEGFVTMKQKIWNYLECGAEAIHVKNGSFSTIIYFPVLEDEAYCKYYNYNFPHTVDYRVFAMSDFY